ncbi:hypothetical protein ACLOJK_007884 [Asimina triloba]
MDGDAVGNRRTSLYPEMDDKPEDLTLNGRKKVTFDLNVKTYEDASAHELPNDVSKSEDEKKGEEEQQKDEKGSQVLSTSENSPTISSTGSFSSNHRYQDCVCSEDEMEDEDEELQYADCDLDDQDEDDKGEQEEESYESCFSLPLERGLRFPDSASPEEGEVCESKPISELSTDQKSTGFTSRNARNRSHYVNSVLNPVENLTQWKAVKARSGPSKQRRKENIDMEQELHPPFIEEPTFNLLKERKENINLDKEMHIPFSTEPIFKIPKPQTDSTPRNAGLGSPSPKQEISVDASLSNWLVSSGSTPSVKNSLARTESSEYSQSPSSRSSRIYDDRPILGALTVEELRQHSVSSSPRRSPSRSPDDVPIVGSVGSYWNSSSSAQSVSGPKGIPNTTSKYREDKRVNWHNTPFEVRLERALVESAAEAYASHRQPIVL